MVRNININKYILATIFSIMIVGTLVSAATMTRDIPNYVNPGQSFVVNYSTHGAIASSGWYVAWEDTTTNCTPNDYPAYMLSTTTGDKSQTQVFQAPSINGTCLFRGYYQFADGTITNFPDVNVQVGNTTIMPVQNQTQNISCSLLNQACGGIAGIPCCSNQNLMCNRNMNVTNSIGVCSTIGGTVTPSECIFTLGTFCVKLWMLLVAGGLILLWIILRK